MIKGQSWEVLFHLTSVTILASLLTGSSTVDLLIYQTLCYTHDELREVDVGDFVLKPCGLEEFLQK